METWQRVPRKALRATRSIIRMFYVDLLHSETDSRLYIGYEAYIEEADAIGGERYLKSGTGRKLIRSQLRNYFAKHPLRTALTESREAQPFTR